MTTRTRSVPCDMLSVEHKGASITIHTHRQKLHVTLIHPYRLTNHDYFFTFNELYAALAKIVEEKAQS